MPNSSPCHQTLPLDHIRSKLDVLLQIHFDNLKEGRLISTFVALFKIRPPPGEPKHFLVLLLVLADKKVY